MRVLHACGARLGVRLDGVPAEPFEALFLPGWHWGGGRPGGWMSVRALGAGFEVDPGTLPAPLQVPDLDRAVMAFDRHLHARVGDLSPRLFLHAGAVAWKGRAAVLPGRSFAGKSTLVRALVAAGARYLSDEMAVLDGRGRVHPYPTPLNLRRGSLRLRSLPAASLAPLEEPVPAGLVWLTRYAPGARGEPRCLTRGRGALALLEHAVSARRHPERALRWLSRLEVYRGDRGEAAEAARWILARLEA